VGFNGTGAALYVRLAQIPITRRTYLRRKQMMVKLIRESWRMLIFSAPFSIVLNALRLGKPMLKVRARY
jgi:hypothetical protein